MYPMYQQPYPQRYEIVHVQGEAGARSLMMSPNSNAILLDDSAPLIWLVQVDGNGNKALTAYDIALHQPEPQIDLGMLMARLDKIEEKINESHTSDAKCKAESGE